MASGYCGEEMSFEILMDSVMMDAMDRFIDLLQLPYWFVSVEML